MRNVLSTLAMTLALIGCDDAAKTDAKPTEDGTKTVSAKKELRIPAKKADVKADTKADTEPDTKADTKVDPKADTPPSVDAGAAASIGKLASLAREIAAKPETADTILEAAGMDRLAFEAAMVEVAKDQWKTDLYLTALADPTTGAG
jgi:hypothetical protein